jgi:hypothetical protein
MTAAAREGLGGHGAAGEPESEVEFDDLSDENDGNDDMMDDTLDEGSIDDGNGSTAGILRSLLQDHTSLPLVSGFHMKNVNIFNCNNSREGSEDNAENSNHSDGNGNTHAIIPYDVKYIQPFVDIQTRSNDAVVADPVGAKISAPKAGYANDLSHTGLFRC